MTTLEDTRTDTLLDRAATVAPVLAEHAGRHDVEGTFVTEALDAIRDAGLLAAGVPVELGGLGADNRELAELQRELAHHCGSTALATSMHQHVVCFTAWRYRRGLPGAEATLRRVAEEGIVLVSTGGGDWTHPRGEAVKVDGGYRVSGHKRFASQSTVGTAMSTMATYDDPEQGRRVLNLAVPFASEGVTVLDNWDTLGMRAHRQQRRRARGRLRARRAGAGQPAVRRRRPAAAGDREHRLPDRLRRLPRRGRGGLRRRGRWPRAAGRTTRPCSRQVGLMLHRLRVAGWALDGALDLVGPDPAPSAETLTAVMVAKREIALAGIEVCDLAMEVAGGSAFFRGSVVERCYRDIRAAKFHPHHARGHAAAGR